MDFKSKQNTTSENKKYNALVKKMKSNPNDLNEAEMDLFLDLMKKASDSNLMKSCNRK